MDCGCKKTIHDYKSSFYYVLDALLSFSWEEGFREGVRTQTDVSEISQLTDDSNVNGSEEDAIALDAVFLRLEELAKRIDTLEAALKDK